MKTLLEPPDSHHLRAAIGWMELGNQTEAHAELDKIASELRLHPDVLSATWSIHAKGKNWKASHDVASTFTRQAPENFEAWVDLSISLYRLGRTQDAWDALAGVADQFPDEWLV